MQKMGRRLERQVGRQMDELYSPRRVEYPEWAKELKYMGAYRKVDFSGYESPIKVFRRDTEEKIQREIDHMVIQRVTQLGVDVDRNELMHALNYDRMQYAEGYKAGYAAAMAAAEAKIKGDT